MLQIAVASEIKKKYFHPMNVLFSSRIDAFKRPGGDTHHLLQTIEALKTQGVMGYTQENWPAECKPDLLHHFNLNRPELGIELIRLYPDVPLVIQAIFVDYSSVESQSESGMRRFLSRSFSPSTIEWLKEILRTLKAQRPLSSWRYLFLGHAKSVQKLLDYSSMVIGASRSELNRIARYYSLSEEKRVVLLPPIQTHYFDKIEAVRENKELLCVGRFEPLKNQLRLIQAVRNTDYSLTLVGRAAPNHKAYYIECRRQAGEKIVFIDHLDSKELKPLYEQSAAHILPSFFETTGLSTLEALACGCGAVVGRNAEVLEIFEGRAVSVDPLEVASIRKGIEMAIRENDKSREWAKSMADPKKLGEQLHTMYKQIRGQ